MYAKKTTAVEKIVLPVTSTFLCGSVTDGGNGNNSYGLDWSLNVYGPSGGVHYICLCTAEANRQWGDTEVPSGYCAIANLPLSANVIKAIGTGSNTSADANYIKSVLRLADLDTTSRIFFRTSEKETPSVFYIAICR